MKIFSLLLLLFFGNSVQAQWTRGNGPYGGNVFNLVTDGNVTVASVATSTAGNVLYRSTDGGLQWSGPIPDVPAGRLFQNDNTIFDCVLTEGSSLKLYVSRDRAVTWYPATKGPDAQVIYQLTSSNGKLFAATDSGLFTSSDDGAIWLIDSGVHDAKGRHGTAGVTRIGSVVLVSLRDASEVERSTDGGMSWIGATAPTTLSNLVVEGPHVFGTANTELYVSKDSGMTWHLQADVKQLTNQNYANGFWTLVSNGTELVAGTYISAMRSTDEGKTWVLFDSTRFRRGTAAALASGQNLLLGTPHGVYRSMDNGSTWRASNEGLGVEAVSALAVDGSDLFVGTSAPYYYSAGAMFRSSNSGQRWTEVEGNDVYTLSGFAGTFTALAASGARLFAAMRSSSGQYLKVRSSDSGASWMDASAELPNDFVDGLFFSDLDLFAGIRNNGIYRSSDQGATWKAANRGLTTSNLDPDAFVASGSILFAGTNGGGVFRTTDRGSSWVECNVGLANFNVTALAAKGSTIFTGTTGGVFRSSNNGDTWTAVSTGLTKQSVTSLAVAGSNIFAGTSPRGVFLSSNDGATWTEISGNLTGFSSLIIAATSTDLVAATDGAGVWRRPLTDFQNAAVAQTPDISGTLYPNPTRNVVRIPRASHAAIRTLLGAFCTFVEQCYGPDLVLDVSGLPAGVYYVRTEEGRVEKFRKE